MDETPRYKVSYTETAIQDIDEKVDYILRNFSNPSLAETWYLRLRDAVQKDLTFFPRKYAIYDVAPWNEKEIRIFTFRNDVVLYSVDEPSKTIYIRGVCTKGRDLSAHLAEDEM